MKLRYYPMFGKLPLVLGLILLTFNACMNEDQQKASSSVNESEITSEANPTTRSADRQYTPLADVLKNYAEAPKSVVISAKKDTLVTFPRGTKVQFKAGSFVNKRTGKPVTGDVELRAKEYYDPSECILSNVTTQSDKGPLESGGMIHLEAFADGEACDLAEGASILISFDTEESQLKGMTLFSGSFDPHGDVVWTEDLQAGIQFNSPPAQPSLLSESSAVEEDVFDEGPGNLEFMRNRWNRGRILTNPECIDCKQYIGDNALEVLKDYLRLGEVHRFKIRMVMDHLGNIDSLYIVNKVNKLADSIVLAAYSNVKYWVPPRVTSDYDTAFTFITWLKVGNFTNFHVFTNEVSTLVNSNMPAEQYKAHIENQENQLKRYQELAAQAEEYQVKRRERMKQYVKKKANDAVAANQLAFVNRYVYESRNLGWINCDRFYNMTTAPVYVTSNIHPSGNESIKLVVKNMRSILQPSRQDKDSFYFQSVPVNSDIILIGIRTVNDELQLAMKELNTSTNRTAQLNYEPVTYAEMEERLKALD